MRMGEKVNDAPERLFPSRAWRKENFVDIALPFYFCFISLFCKLLRGKGSWHFNVPTVIHCPDRVEMKICSKSDPGKKFYRQTERKDWHVLRQVQKPPTLLFCFKLTDTFFTDLSWYSYSWNVSTIPSLCLLYVLLISILSLDPIQITVTFSTTKLFNCHSYFFAGELLSHLLDSCQNLLNQ